MSTYERVLSFLIEKWGHLGVERTSDGCVFIGSFHDSKYAYLHRLMPPLSEADLTELQTQLHVPLPDSVRSFLVEANGASFYYARIPGLRTGRPAFNIYGLRTAYREGSFDTLLRQPYDMVAENMDGIIACDNQALNVTNYSDGSRVYITMGGNMFRMLEDGTKANEWADLESWLMSELKRLAALFDKNGKALVELELMAPPWSVA